MINGNIIVSFIMNSSFSWCGVKTYLRKKSLMLAKKQRRNKWWEEQNNVFKQHDKKHFFFKSLGSVLVLVFPQNSTTIIKNGRCGTFVL